MDVAQDLAKAIEDHNQQFGNFEVGFPAGLADDINIIPHNPNHPSSSSAVPVKVKTNFLSLPRTEEIAGDNAANADGAGIEVAAINGLVSLSVGIQNLVEMETLRLEAARHDAFGPVTSISERLEEEKERLKHVTRKLMEKQASYDRAVVEYEQSRAVLAAAKEDE